MDKYIIIKELPDASVGTEVIWDESANAFYYEKECFVSPHKRNYLSAGQVTQTPEYFCKAQEYPEYYAYKYPVYSREEVLKLLKDSFPNKSLSGEYNVSASKELKAFEEGLRKLGKSNAEIIVNVSIAHNGSHTKQVTMSKDKTVYFQPPGIAPKYCEVGMISETDPEYIWYYEEPCKILISEVKIVPKEEVIYDKKKRSYLVKSAL